MAAARFALSPLCPTASVKSFVYNSLGTWAFSSQVIRVKGETSRTPLSRAEVHI